MVTKIKPVFKYILRFGVMFIFTTSGVLFLSAERSNAQRGCHITVCKQAEGAGDQLFHFTIILRGDQSTQIIQRFVTVGCDVGFTVLPGVDGQITEEPVPGWPLTITKCESASGVIIDNIDNGIDISCTEPTDEDTVCTFVNGAVSNIPTLSEWGMIAAAAGLGLIGFFFSVRRRRVVVNS